jgi:hypothetical protein
MLQKNSVGWREGRRRQRKKKLFGDAQLTYASSCADIVMVSDALGWSIWVVGNGGAAAECTSAAMVADQCAKKTSRGQQRWLTLSSRLNFIGNIMQQQHAIFSEKCPLRTDLRERRAQVCHFVLEGLKIYTEKRLCQPN